MAGIVGMRGFIAASRGDDARFQSLSRCPLTGGAEERLKSR
jgi:hypothetical protein